MLIYPQKVIICPQSVPFFPRIDHLTIFLEHHKNDLRTFVEKWRKLHSRAFVKVQKKVQKLYFVANMFFVAKLGGDAFQCPESSCSPSFSSSSSSHKLCLAIHV